MMNRDSSIDSNLSNEATSKDRPARKSTIHDLYAIREKHRARSVKQCRSAAEQISQNNTKIHNMEVLFRNEVIIFFMISTVLAPSKFVRIVKKLFCVIFFQEFSRALFNLFDYDAVENIDQTEFIETLKINTR